MQYRSPWPNPLNSFLSVSYRMIRGHSRYNAGKKHNRKSLASHPPSNSAHPYLRGETRDRYNRSETNKSHRHLNLSEPRYLFYRFLSAFHPAHVVSRQAAWKQDHRRQHKSYQPTTIDHRYPHFHTILSPNKGFLLGSRAFHIPFRSRRYIHLHLRLQCPQTKDWDSFS